MTASVPRTGPKNRLGIVAAAILLAGCSTAPIALQRHVSEAPGNNGGSFNFNVCTFGKGNGVVCNPSRVEFTEEIGQQLLAHMPDSKKPILLTTLGPSNADQSVGAQVQQYLTGRGRTVHRLSIGQMVAMPNYPFSLQTDEKQYELTVAPSAH